MHTNYTPKVSIIIPVYNAELFLRRCVESILMQDYKSLEIILVDDCSKDSSREICKLLASENDNISTIFQEKNSGAAAARNAGIRTASGKYIIFMDSDDHWIGQVPIKKYVKLLDNSPRINFIITGLITYHPESNKYIKSTSYPKVTTDPNVLSINKQHALVSCGSFPNSPCNKIISKDFIMRNELFFPEGITAEDIVWYIRLTEVATNFLCINDYYYVYDQSNEFSVTKSTSKSLLKVVTELSKKYKKSSTDFAQIVLSYMAYEYILLLTDLKKYDEEERKIILSHDWLRQFDMNNKVRISNRFIKILGRNLTVSLINLYKNKIRKNFSLV